MAHGGFHDESGRTREICLGHAVGSHPGHGRVTAACAAVGDLVRLRIGTIAYAAFGVLSLIAVGRYPAMFPWDRPSGWIFIGVMVGIIATGAPGWPAATREVAGSARD
jgi:hypothetical protein